MSGIVVTTVEELRSASKSRSHPNIFIQGELANNLLISGIFRVKGESAAGEGQVVQLNALDSLMYPICEILHELSRSNLFQIGGESGRCQIKVYPKPVFRREGN
ncbi:MAG: hypothetical protein HY914_03840 [Desulfomonile tiedjei]|nr:hypothetical protein [Desulfomonile tiedjei]